MTKKSDDDDDKFKFPDDVADAVAMSVFGALWRALPRKTKYVAMAELLKFINTENPK